MVIILKCNNIYIYIYFFLVSHSFGYGLMDATAMVRLARRWKTVPVQHICNVTAQVFEKYDNINFFIFFS